MSEWALGRAIAARRQASRIDAESFVVRGLRKEIAALHATVADLRETLFQADQVVVYRGQVIKDLLASTTTEGS